MSIVEGGSAMTESRFAVTHVRMTSDRPFADVQAAFEQRLWNPDPSREPETASIPFFSKRGSKKTTRHSCVGPNCASDGTETKAHRSLENSFATAVMLRLPRFSSIALRKMLRTALTVGIDASPPPVCTV